MEWNALHGNLGLSKESASLTSRFALVVFCLAAGFAYRFIVGLFPASILQATLLSCLAAFFLVLTVLARRQETLSLYAEIPFSFFVFTIAGIAGDQSGWIQQMFTRNILHETPGIHNPLGTTLMGTVWSQLFSTACLLIPILLLTRASGSNLKSIFIDRMKTWWPLAVGLLGFLLYFRLTASGRAERFFPNNGLTPSQFLVLTPALLILVLCNGFREELWFRGLFLKKYGKFLSPFSANLLSAVIFAAFHVQVQYTPALLPFLGFALLLGLLFGYLIQKSGSILPSTILHAGSDLPIFLVYLSYTLA